jgi:peptide-methionine (S)-S-oxide reductase
MNQPSESSDTPSRALATATLGGGCFWCLEAVFQRLRGVHSVTSGYAGGREPNPSYREVCSGTTGHAEVVQVAFDPDTLSFRELLEVFFAIHDPTTPDRQGADVGPQYRSIILTHDEEQARVAREVMTEEQEGWDDPIVTELTSYETFYPAESEHHDYYDRNPRQAYCRLVIDPKVKTARRRFTHLLAE